MPGFRKQRLGDHIRAVLSELLGREVEDPRVRGVLVTEVRMSPDAHQATIYYSVTYGGEPARREAGLGLERARGFLRRELGRRIRLRVTPDLRFVPDRSVDHAAHVDEVLREIYPEGVPPEPGSEGEPGPGGVAREPEPEPGDDDDGA